MVTVVAKKNKLKELLAQIGERIKPSLKRDRIRYEKMGVEADKKRVNILKERKERKRNQLTGEERKKLFQGPPVNAFKRHQQVKDIIKNR
jgi:hypothetical protein